MKKNNSYTINLDDEQAEQLEELARLTQRKPRELLRLLVAPVIESELVKIKYQPMTLTPAHFVPSWLDNLPKL